MARCSVVLVRATRNAIDWSGSAFSIDVKIVVKKLHLTGLPLAKLLIKLSER